MRNGRTTGERTEKERETNDERLIRNLQLKLHNPISGRLKRIVKTNQKKKEKMAEVVENSFSTYYLNIILKYNGDKEQIQRKVRTAADGNVLLINNKRTLNITKREK